MSSLFSRSPCVPAPEPCRAAVPLRHTRRAGAMRWDCCSAAGTAAPSSRRGQELGKEHDLPV